MIKRTIIYHFNGQELCVIFTHSDTLGGKVVNMEGMIGAEVILNKHAPGFCVPQEREEAEALWDMDKQVKREEEEEEGKSAGNARSQARQQKRESRGRVTGGRDEL